MPTRKPAGAKKRPRKPRRSRAETEALRYAARCSYTLDHNPMTLEQLARQPMFAAIGLAKLAQWAEEEGWPDERRANIVRWKQRAESRLRASLMQRTQHQRQMVQSLHDQAVALRCQQVVQPKSWEQVANVQLKAATLLHQMHREEVSSAAQLSAPRQAASSGEARQRVQGLPVEMLDGSDEEYMQSAHALLEKRMADRQRDEGVDLEPASDAARLGGAAQNAPPAAEETGEIVELNASHA